MILKDLLQVVHSDVHILHNSLNMLTIGKACGNFESYVSADLLDRKVKSIEVYNGYLRVYLKEEENEM